MLDIHGIAKLCELLALAASSTMENRSMEHIFVHEQMSIFITNGVEIDK